MKIIKDLHPNLISESEEEADGHTHSNINPIILVALSVLSRYTWTKHNESTASDMHQRERSDVLQNLLSNPARCAIAPFESWGASITVGGRRLLDFIGILEMLEGFPSRAQRGREKHYPKLHAAQWPAFEFSLSSTVSHLRHTL